MKITAIPPLSPAPLSRLSIAFLFITHRQNKSRSVMAISHNPNNQILGNAHYESIKYPFLIFSTQFRRISFNINNSNNFFFASFAMFRQVNHLNNGMYSGSKTRSDENHKITHASYVCMCVCAALHQFSCFVFIYALCV